jgi:hypothetical protein
MAPNTRCLTVPGPERVRHLAFQHLLHDHADNPAQPIRALAEKLLTAEIAGLASDLVMAAVLPRRIR